MHRFQTTCNQSVSATMIKCPLGLLQLETCTAGVHSLKYVWTPAVDLDPISVFDVSIGSSQENLTDPAKLTFEWLLTYFRNPENLDGIPIPNFCFISSPLATENRFIDKVMAELRKIPFGETVTYGELAERAGNAKASRAVGTVMKSNPACLIIPCHRVILKSGMIGKYSGGKNDGVKEWLIKYEAEKAGKDKI